MATIREECEQNGLRYYKLVLVKENQSKEYIFETRNKSTDSEWESTIIQLYASWLQFWCFNFP